MVQPLPSTSSIQRDIGKGILTGAALTAFQAPLANAINRVSIIGCHDNVSMRKAAERIYRGTADGVLYRTLSHSSMSGIFLKSFPISACITPPVWIFECLKNHLQMHPQLSKAGNKTSYYKEAFRHILTTQGSRGFRNGGLIAKIYYNAYLAMGANWMLERARAAQKDKP